MPRRAPPGELESMDGDQMTSSTFAVTKIVHDRRARVNVARVASITIMLVFAGNPAHEARGQQVEAIQISPPAPRASAGALTLTGDLRAWHESPVYARVKGYLKRWYVDFGENVKAGQLLADVDTPDLDAALAAAEAKFTTANAVVETRQTEWEFAKSTYERWHNAPVGVVSIQGTLTKQDDYEVATARLHIAMAEAKAAKSELEGLRAQLDFKRITSPIDGVLTERNVDIGMPVNDSCLAGERPDGPLFRIIDPHKIRLFVNVPQDKSARIEAGLKANLSLPQFPGKIFPAVVVSQSHAIDEKSQTLLVELHIDNPDGALQPGSRGEVQIELASNPQKATDGPGVPSSKRARSSNNRRFKLRGHKPT
jgi:RND family efflux transporter MFP subunit